MLSTDDTRITVRASGGQLDIVDLRHPRADRSWAPKPMPVPLLSRVWSGLREVATRWDFQEVRTGDGTGSFTWIFRSASPALELRSIWRAGKGRGPVEHRIEIGGKRYPKGLWTHSFEDGTPADVALAIPAGEYASFAADVGLEDSSGGGSIRFQVLLDGLAVAETPVLRPGQRQALRVPLGGAKQITLRVLNGGDGYTCDHAAWGFARFVKKGAADPLGE
jgi:hypothetical protein